MMTEETQHAKFSPSSAHRWGECPGSMVLELDYPDTSSAYADEGTAAHTLAQWCLTQERDASYYAGERIEVREGKTVSVDASMVEYVQGYVDRVRRDARGFSLLVEQRVCFEQTLGLKPGEGFGTADALIVNGTHLTVADLKYGRGERVDAEENVQMMLYALGAIETYGDLVGPFETFTLVVDQPRVAGGYSHWYLDRGRLEEFALDMRNSVRAAREALGDAGNVGKYLRPSEKACRWCKAKANCPAIFDRVQETIGARFDDLTDEVVAAPATYGDNALPEAMAAVGLVEDWCKAVRAETERRLLAGKSVTGWKLVQGRKGARAWTSEAEAETMLKDKFRLKVDEMYSKSVISPTQAVKLLKDQPARLKQVEALVTQAAGKPSVAPVSDKREEYKPAQFDDESEAVW
jgi:hypothetical protein